MSLLGYDLKAFKVVHPRVAFVNKKRIDESPELVIKDVEQPKHGDLKMIKIKNCERQAKKYYERNECSLRCYNIQEFLVNF